MQRSESHILTTHAGALPRPDDLLPLAAATGPLTDSGSTGRARLRTAVAKVVERQRKLGLAIVNDGEFGKDRDFSRLADWLEANVQAEARPTSIAALKALLVPAKEIEPETENA